MQAVDSASEQSSVIGEERPTKTRTAFMSRFLSYLLNLRGAAIFIVVGVHARGNLSDWGTHLTSHDFLSTFFDAREGNGTVMFIFIGGFLFQYITHNNFNFKKYLEKKFMYVLLPYILVSIPIIAFRIYANYSFALPPGFNDQPVLYRFFYYLLTGLHLAPFWFISTIVLFYLSAPLFHALDNPKAYCYLFPLIFITCFFTYRPLNNANPLLSYVHFFPIYFLGMWASHNRAKILSLGDWFLYLLAILYAGIVVSDLTGLLWVHERISFEEIWRNHLLLFNIDLLKAVLLCFILMILMYKFREKRLLFLEILGEYSFGIFFVHCIFIYGTNKVWTDLFGPMEFSMVSFIIYFSYILLISTAMVFFVKKMTGRYSRILIGS